MKFVLIYNWKCPENDWFKEELEKSGNEVVVIDNPDDGEIRYKKWHRAVNFMECLLMALRAIKMDKDYVIVSMCATPGIIASIMDISQHKIVALNLLCHTQKNPTVVQRIRDAFYRKAFANPNLYSTCNEDSNREDYIKRFNIRDDRRLLILEDAISSDEIASNVNESEYIFSGGASARDWETLLGCAELTPEYKYCICARESDWPKGKLLTNVNVSFNVPKETFNDLLVGSKLILVPLNSDITAGLLVLLNAIKQNKMVLCTDTKTIRKFLPQKFHSKLLCKMFDCNDLQNKVKWAMNLSDAARKEIADELKAHFYEKYSTDAYMKKFRTLVDSIEDY